MQTNVDICASCSLLSAMWATRVLFCIAGRMRLEDNGYCSFRFKTPNEENEPAFLDTMY